MRMLFTNLCFLLSMIICNAQIAPPKQTDTLVISAVKYNYADIYKSNWPCETIYKSTQDIRIGDKVFNVLDAKKLGEVIIFFVYDADDPNMKEYELNFSENEDGTFLLSFSGYEFQCSMKKHISTEHNTSNISETKAKIADGNPNAHVKGRNIVGNIPHPACNVQESGVVVVNIWVDNYGNVVKAVPGGDGTTVLDKTLYAAARKAAMETRFNMNADAPAMQEGTITYYFNIPSI